MGIFLYVLVGDAGRLNGAAIRLNLPDSRGNVAARQADTTPRTPQRSFSFQRRGALGWLLSAQ
jgi:hypothetical protein